MSGAKTCVCGASLSRVRVEEGEEWRLVAPFGFFGGESVPPAASFQDVACAVGDGVDVELRHVVNPERPT